MCNPIAIGAVMAIAMAAQTYQGMQAEKSMKEKQSKLEKESARMQAEAATRARDLDLKTLEAKEQQTQQSAEVEKFDRVRQSAKEASAIRLASSEAGVMGSSIFRMMASTQIQEAHDLGIVEANKQNSLDQIGRDKTGVDATYDARMNQSKLTEKQAKYTKDSAPSIGSIFMGTTMAGISSGMSAYGAAGGSFGGGGTTGGAATGGKPYIPAF